MATLTFWLRKFHKKWLEGGRRKRKKLVDSQSLDKLVSSSVNVLDAETGHRWSYDVNRSAVASRVVHRRAPFRHIVAMVLKTRTRAQTGRTRSRRSIAKRFVTPNESTTVHSKRATACTSRAFTTDQWIRRDELAVVRVAVTHPARRRRCHGRRHHPSHSRTTNPCRRVSSLSKPWVQVSVYY